MANLVPALSGAMKERPQLLFAACAALIFFIAGADYLTGYEFALSLLYMLPIYAAAWLGGRSLSWVMVSLATIAWCFTDIFAGHGYSHPFYRFWETAIHFFTYGIFAEVLLRLKLALARSDERFVMALEGMEAAVCVADTRSGALLFANGRFRRDFGKALLREDIDSLWRLLGLPRRDCAAAELEGPHAAHVYLVRERSIRWTDGQPVRLVSLTDITAH
jgi:PAS domain-containing protein